MNHSFDIGHAKSYGVDEAIMISNFQYWLKKNWANDKHKHDGRTWTYNSVTAFEKLFPYWTAKQIRRVLDSLVTQGVLMRGEYNKSVYDRTSWYSFVDESTLLFGNSELPKWETQDDQKGTPIPNINTDINTDKKPNKKGGDLHEKIQTIVSRINKHAGTSFKAETKESARMISARLKDYSVDDALRVVDVMAGKWLKTDMRQYYVPTTLFRESNFEKYLQMASASLPTSDIPTANNPDFKLGKFRYRPQSEFGSYTQYLKNCEQYGHTPKEQGHD